MGAEASVRHLSLDLWLTLIRSNPAFKPARTKLFVEHFSVARDEAEVARVFRHFDRFFDAVNARTGGNVTVAEMLYVILEDLGVRIEDVDHARVTSFYALSEELLLRHPPRLLDESVPSFLQSLRDSGFGVSLLSNTGFILGRTLRRILPTIGLEDCFDFELYSDELRASKPNPEVFTTVYEKATAAGTLTRAEILHVGDNPEADVRGARAAGMQALMFDRDRNTLAGLLADRLPASPLRPAPHHGR